MKRYRQKNSLASAALVAAMALSGSACKQDGGGSDGGSNTKTLDNFARTDGAALLPTSCGIQMSMQRYENLSTSDKKKLTRISAPTDELKLQVAGALTAAPLPLQTLFFAAAGKVNVVSDPATICGDAGLTETEKEFAAENTAEIDACWKAEQNGLEIVLKDDPATIHHQLIRMLGFVYSEFYATRLQSKSAPKSLAKPIADGIARLKRQGEALSTAFLHDLQASGDAKTYGRLNSLEHAVPDEFAHFVIAEAIDSYYCSAETADSFRKNFQATYAAFTAGEALKDDMGQAWYERKLQ